MPPKPGCPSGVTFPSDLGGMIKLTIAVLRSQEKSAILWKALKMKDIDDLCEQLVGEEKKDNWVWHRSFIPGSSSAILS